jgi:hypothetical protein
MKIFFSLVLLGALALIIRKLGLKKIEEIGKGFMHSNTKDAQETKAPEINTTDANKKIENKELVAGETTQTQSLELPLELQAILSAIKAKLHFSVDEDNNGNTEQDNNTENDNSDYGSHGSYGNDGGGGGALMPYQPAIVTPVTATTATPVFSSISNTPIKFQPLPIKSFGNLSNILNGLGTTPQVTPTPTPNTPIINNVHTSTASSARTSNNHSHRHGGVRRRF